MHQSDTTPWQAAAACAGLSPSVVFSRRGKEAAPALRACAVCPVSRECEAAVAPAESWFDGVCAGRLWRNGRPVPPRRHRGRAAAPHGPAAPAEGPDAVAAALDAAAARLTPTTPDRTAPDRAVPRVVPVPVSSAALPSAAARPGQAPHGPVVSAPAPAAPAARTSAAPARTPDLVRALVGSASRSAGSAVPAGGLRG